MGAIDFYKTILPVSSNYVFCYVKKENGQTQVKQKLVKSIDELVTISNKHLDTDCYFALSGFKQGWYQDHAGKLRLRTQENAGSQKCLWADLDVGIAKTGRFKYATLRDAALALNAFVTTTGLPKPTVVKSGYGLHCYWAFDRDLSTAQWEDLAAKFFAVTTHFNLQVDPTRAVDAASILRCPGTKNFKDSNNPRDVIISRLYQANNVDWLTSHIERLFYENNLTLPERTQAKPASELINVPDYVQQAMLQYEVLAPTVDINDKTSINDAVNVVNGCQQIHNMGFAIEPNWFGAMTVLARCFNGRLVAHDLSARDTVRYNEYVTNDKFDHAAQLDGPQSCQTFNLNCPGVCNNCPYYGVITTPLQLADGELQSRSTTQPAGVPAIQQKTNAIVVNQYPIPDFDNYVHQGNRLLQTYTNKDTGEQFTKEIFKFTPIPLYKECRMSGNEMTTNYIWKVAASPTPVKLKGDDIAKGSVPILSFLVNVQCYIGPNLEKQAVLYMKHYIKELQDRLPLVIVSESIGWITTIINGQESYGFTYGNKLLLPNKNPEMVTFNDGVVDYVRLALGEKGTVDGWKKAVSSYKENDMWAHLGIALGFGATLMYFHTGSARNGIVNFYSNESGTGKTTLQQVVASIYGHPTMQLIGEATINARMELFGIRKNLPMLLDETTNVDDKQLSSVIFEMANGMGKSRMKQSQELSSSKMWQTIAMTSANNTMADKIAASNSSREGEQMRVMDVLVPRLSNTLSRDTFEQHIRGLNSNYGVVGRVFIQHLLDSDAVSTMPERLHKTAMSLSEAAAHRFWSNTLSAAVVATEITNSLGITNVDINKLITYCKSLMKFQQTYINSNIQTPTEVLSDFISAMRPNMVIVKGENRTDKQKPSDDIRNDPYIVYIPLSAELKVRFEQDTNSLYVPKHVFKQYLAQGNHGKRFIENQLTELGIMQHNWETKERYIISKNIPGMPTARTTCYKFILPDEITPETPTNVEPEIEE